MINLPICPLAITGAIFRGQFALQFLWPRRRIASMEKSSHGFSLVFDPANSKKPRYYLPVNGEKFKFGRKSSPVDNKKISKNHAEIWQLENDVYLKPVCFGHLLEMVFSRRPLFPPEHRFRQRYYFWTPVIPMASYHFLHIIVAEIRNLKFFQRHLTHPRFLPFSRLARTQCFSCFRLISRR